MAEEPGKCRYIMGILEKNKKSKGTAFVYDENNDYYKMEINGIEFVCDSIHSDYEKHAVELAPVSYTHLPPDYPAVHYKTQGIHQKGSDALPADSNQGYHCRWKCGHAENDDAGSQGQRQVENRDTDCQGKNNAFYGIADVKSSV